MQGPPADLESRLFADALAIIVEKKGSKFLC